MSSSSSSSSSSEDEVPGMAGLSPSVGMRLEVRDADYIWSPARVMKVEKKKKSNDFWVTVRFDGWDASYDERVLWSCNRLVPLFTYTKQAKCFVELFSKPKGKPNKNLLDALPATARKAFATVWPCIVQFRMPHPVVEDDEDEESCVYAEEFLRLEANIYIQPYGLDLLPHYIRESFHAYGGRWMKAASKLRLWKDDPIELGVLPKDFDEAFRMAMQDSATGGMTVQALEGGTLLKAEYRVLSRKGAPIRDGALRAATRLPERFLEDSVEPAMKPPAVVQIRQPLEESPAGQDEEPQFAPPPSFPPPMRLTEPIFPGCGIQKCKKSNQWVASITVRGSNVFLGSFPTQTQAYQATRIATGENVAMETDLEKAQRADLEAMPIEALVCAVENQWNAGEQNFCFHEYTLQEVRHRMYENHVREQEEQGKETPAASPKQEEEPETKHKGTPKQEEQPKKKRKGIPRRKDLEKGCWA